MLLLVQFTIVGFLATQIAGLQIPTEEYQHSAPLDTNEKVKLYWKFNNTHITFEVSLDMYVVIGYW